MLYYICPMHTLWTLCVYFCLLLRPAWHETTLGVLAKLGACLAAVALIWDVPGVFDTLWRPLQFLVGYSNPLAAKPNSDALYEARRVAELCKLRPMAITRYEEEW